MLSVLSTHVNSVCLGFVLADRIFTITHATIYTHFRQRQLFKLCVVCLLGWYVGVASGYFYYAERLSGLTCKFAFLFFCRLFLTQMIRFTVCCSFTCLLPSSHSFGSGSRAAISLCTSLLALIFLCVFIGFKKRLQRTTRQQQINIKVRHFDARTKNLCAQANIFSKFLDKSNRTLSSAN